MKLIAFMLAAYMSLGSLFPLTDFSQLPRLREAIEHYRQHRLQQENGDQAMLGFFDFVRQHFIDPASHNHGPLDQSHQQLPFHSLNKGPILNHHFAHIFWIPGSGHSASRSLFHYAGFSHRDYSSFVFQPPLGA